MANAGVAEGMREVAAEGSHEGSAGEASAPDSAEPSVAAAMGDLEEDADGAAGGEDERAGDRTQGPGAAGGEDSASGESPPVEQSSTELPLDRSSDGGGTDVDDELPLRNSEPGPPESNPDNLRRIRQASRRQAEDTREDASEKAAQVVRTEVKRILGLDGRPDFEAESVQHIMGLTRDGQRVDPELEKELRAELDALGLDLGLVKLRYESMSREDRRQLTTFEVQQAFLRVVERVEKLASQASVSLGHRIRMFDAEARDQLKLVAALRVLLETEQGKVEELVVSFRNHIQEQTDDLKDLVVQEKKAIAGKVKDLQTAFADMGGHMKSCETRVQEIDSRLESAGVAATAVEQQAARVMTELQRADGSARAVWRLALLGGVVGSAAGGFFAFIVMLLLWAATSG